MDACLLEYLEKGFELNYLNDFKIKGVENLTWGQNVSPEKLNKGLTHSLTMTFKNEYDRDSIYLPHPTHVDFGEVFVPELENLVVYDYWSNN